MTGRELEVTLRRHGGKPWHQYKRRKEGFIINVVTEHAGRGQRVTRREAQEWWYERVEREL